MLDYEQSIVIDVPADVVFSFVSNLNNLPKFLPALRPEAISASLAGQTRPTEATAFRSSHRSPHECDASGYFRVQPAEYFMEWCSETGRRCTGWLEVDELGESSEVTVHLAFHPDPVAAASMKADIARIDAALEAELSTVMSTIKSLCEASFPASRQPVAAEF